MHQLVYECHALGLREREISVIIHPLYLRTPPALQDEAGALRAGVRGGLAHQAVRGARGGLPHRHAGHHGHAAQDELRLQGHRHHAAIRLPRLAAAAVDQPLRR